MRSQLIRDTRSWATLISILIVFFYKMLIARWCCLLTSYSRKAKDEDGRRVLRPGRIVLSLLLFLAGSSFFLCVSRCRLGLRSSLRSQPWQKKKEERKKKYLLRIFCMRGTGVRRLGVLVRITIVRQYLWPFIGQTHGRRRM